MIALTNGSGAIEERYAYSAYGEPVFVGATGTVLTDSAKDNRYTYTGREWDEELSLYHFRARMYDAGSGRFCVRDPIQYFDGLLIYSFAGGKSLIAVDPTGHYSIGMTVSPSTSTKSCAGFHIDAPIRISVENMDNRWFPLYLVQKIAFSYTASKCNLKDNCCKKEEDESDNCVIWEILGQVEISNKPEGVVIMPTPNHTANEPGVLQDNWSLRFNQGDCGSLGSVSQKNEIKLVSDSRLEAIWRTSNPDSPVESCGGVKHLPGPSAAPSDWDQPVASFSADISYNWNCCSSDMRFLPINLTIATSGSTSLE